MTTELEPKHRHRNQPKPSNNILYIHVRELFEGDPETGDLQLEQLKRWCKANRIPLNITTLEAQDNSTIPLFQTDEHPHTARQLTQTT